MISQEDARSQTRGAGRYLIVYLCVLVLAALQFVVAYSNLSTYQMFVRMLMLAVAEAIIAVLFFMHLWAENRGFVVCVVILTLFVLASLQFGWTDSFRLITCGGLCT
jgi:cytochrome c oxidase subunit IV